jgi:hypothetical protein
MPFSAQLGSYDTIKSNILIKRLGFKDGIYLHFASSMCSAVITTTASNPFDVIKVTTQVCTSQASFIFTCLVGVGFV